VDRLIVTMVAATALVAQENPNKRLRNAADALQEVMAAPDKAIPRDLFDKAQCIVLVARTFPKPKVIISATMQVEDSMG
jgi:lipid-binding SYLF domain-containing protein